MRYSYDIKLWKDSNTTSCPKLRYNHFEDCWVSKRELSPCKKGDCNMTNCHNFKKEFDEKERLIIIRKRGEKK